ncbi:hypothetical protein VOLCADRAFT_94227 [Volvox carteri f. nagariensis]|uniref:Uncharacterized protein n=1 Tax=Volvox carteri f. nagariensis TaxID=3068 RepID=D8U4G9_VOLCA|nr:uncharacterized protein VOLCADRAFT_94227 [Volvox carteri f. nagariensis]EFJ45401.1 hypothetical protein VOLCADRAFT_94227 [Volvox carteri f. nagariensis]|eukprot:XP_002953428.1 hypothetical protein VOLCADRAFT_94227 [Volvox carteri f. nagariensis]
MNTIRSNCRVPGLAGALKRLSVMGCTASCLVPAVADLRKSVKEGDEEGALRRLSSCPKLLSSPVSLFSSEAVTPLHVACERKRTPAALKPYCRRTGAQLPCSVEGGVQMAVQMVNSKDSPELVQVLLSKGADPWACDLHDGRTALHYAAMGRGSAALVALLRGIPAEMLVREGCRYTDARSNCGLSALHYSAHAGNVEALRVLLYDHHLDMIAATSSESFDELCLVASGSTPLHFAAVRGNLAAADRRVIDEPSLEDPRTHLDAAGQTPHQVLMMVHPADVALSALLRPNQPVREALRAGIQAGGPGLDLGPPALAALAADVLRIKLQADVRAAAAAAAVVVVTAAAAAMHKPPTAAACSGGGCTGCTSAPAESPAGIQLLHVAVDAMPYKTFCATTAETL